MKKYIIESTYLQHLIILTGEDINEMFEMFVAYCDYNGIDEDDIQCTYQDGEIIKASAEQTDGKNIAYFYFTKGE